MTAQVRVLIADDHQEMLEDIQDLLEPEFEVVGSATTGEGLLSAAADLKPDVIITDISMPQMDGIEATRNILQTAPASKIILLTIHSDPAMVRLGLSVGALGYVLKFKAGQELAGAIREVLQGNRYVSPLALC